jgi:hypothetical protein
MAENAAGCTVLCGRTKTIWVTDQTWRNQADKFTWRDDLCVVPERRKMLAITRDQKVRTRRIRALDKDVVVWTARYLDPA